MKTQLKMVKGDLTAVDADAIVNSANNDLVMGGGVSGAIRRAAGPEPQDECHKIGTIPLGTAVITTGGLLKARYIIHAAVNPLGMWADGKSVRNATRAALKKADENQVKRLAFPALGTGAGALAVERCADILIEEVMKHCENDQTPLEEVMFVLYDDKPFAIFEEKYKVKVLGEAPTAEIPDERSVGIVEPPPLPPPPPPPPPGQRNRPPQQQGGGRRGDSGRRNQNQNRNQTAGPNQNQNQNRNQNQPRRDQRGPRPPQQQRPPQGPRPAPPPAAPPPPEQAPPPPPPAPEAPPAS